MSSRVSRYRWVDYEVFERGAILLNVPLAQLSYDIGYSYHAYTIWKMKGKIPLVASLAIECLMRTKVPV